MSRAGTLLIFALASTILVGCGPQSMFGAGTMARSRVVSISPINARDRVLSFLIEHGFATDILGDDRLTVRGGAPVPEQSWGACPNSFVDDPFSDLGRSSFVAPISSRAFVIVRISTIGERTSVAVETELFGTYPQPFLNSSFELSCPRTGELERLILAALD